MESFESKVSCENLTRGIVMPNYAAPNVTRIQFLSGYKIKFFFGGQTKVVDFATSDLLERFPRLQQKDFFHKATLDGGSLAWPNDLHVDLDEIIYECPSAEEDFPATGRLLAALKKLTT